MPKRILSGVVENNSQDKTVVVRVERRFIDPLLKLSLIHISEPTRPY